MKILSVRQPWAHLIIHGGKDIENRKWKTKLRGRIFIHAGMRDDKTAIAKFTDKGLIRADDLVRGAIIGSVEIVDCVDYHPSSWFEGPYGFVLKDPKPEPIRLVKGKLGMFEDKGVVNV